MKYIAVLAMLLCATTVAAQTTPPDTLDIYGGPGTLEGKFQTEAGEPDEQGWVDSIEVGGGSCRSSRARILNENP